MNKAYRVGKLIRLKDSTSMELLDDDTEDCEAGDLFLITEASDTEGDRDYTIQNCATGSYSLWNWEILEAYFQVVK